MACTRNGSSSGCSRICIEEQLSAAISSYQLPAISYQQSTRVGPTVARTDPVQGCHPEGETDRADGDGAGGSLLATDSRSRNDEKKLGTAARDAPSAAGRSSHPPPARCARACPGHGTIRWLRPIRSIRITSP